MYFGCTIPAFPTYIHFGLSCVLQVKPPWRLLTCTTFTLLVMTTEISPGIVESPQGDTVVSVDNSGFTLLQPVVFKLWLFSLGFVAMSTLLVIGWPLGCPLFIVCLPSLCPWSLTGLLMFEWLRPQTHHVPVSASIFPYWIFFQVVCCFLPVSLDHSPLCPVLPLS